MCGDNYYRAGNGGLNRKGAYAGAFNKRPGRSSRAAFSVDSGSAGPAGRILAVAGSASTTDNHARLALCDFVGWAYGFDDGIALTAGWQAVDENSL